MEIRPASIDDVALGRDGKRYLVTAEAGSIARDLKDIDPRLFVEFHEPPAPVIDGVKVNPYYSVCCQVDEHKVDLVCRVREEDFDQRVVDYVRRLNYDLRHGRDQADAWDAADAERKRASERKLEEIIGERAYPLMRSIQREVLGINPRSFYMPRRRAA